MFKGRIWQPWGASTDAKTAMLMAAADAHRFKVEQDVRGPQELRLRLALGTRQTDHVALPSAPGLVFLARDSSLVSIYAGVSPLYQVDGLNGNQIQLYVLLDARSEASASITLAFHCLSCEKSCLEEFRGTAPQEGGFSVNAWRLPNSGSLCCGGNVAVSLNPRSKDELSGVLDFRQLSAEDLANVSTLSDLAKTIEMGKGPEQHHIHEFRDTKKHRPVGKAFLHTPNFCEPLFGNSATVFGYFGMADLALNHDLALLNICLLAVMHDLVSPPKEDVVASQGRHGVPPHLYLNYLVPVTEHLLGVLADKTSCIASLLSAENRLSRTCILELPFSPEAGARCNEFLAMNHLPHVAKAICFEEAAFGSASDTMLQRAKLPDGVIWVKIRRDLLTAAAIPDDQGNLGNAEGLHRLCDRAKSRNQGVVFEDIQEHMLLKALVTFVTQRRYRAQDFMVQFPCSESPWPPPPRAARRPIPSSPSQGDGRRMAPLTR